MDFLLECIGFPPDHDLATLVELVRRAGERAPWRGPDGQHFRLPLGGGLELRADRDHEGAAWSVLPYFQAEQRLRLAIERVRAVPDSRYDALVTGWANPPVGGPARGARESFPISAVLTDARRIPRDLARGHVLAVSLAGFALDVEAVGDERELRAGGDASPFDDGGWVRPLGGADDPGGTVEIALRVQSVQNVRNPLTGAEVSLLEVSTPGRPLVLFASPWQIESDGLPAPAPGAIVRGVFVLTGRIAGGLRSATERVGRSFG